MWNQDNREKVLRDERIHREKLAAQEQDEQRRLEEFNLERLRSQAETKYDIEDTSDDKDIKKESSLQRFQLFDDPALTSTGKVSENDEYVKERKAKEMAEMKRQGVAPLALGDRWDMSLSFIFRPSNQPRYTYTFRSAGNDPILPWYLDNKLEDSTVRKRHPDLEKVVLEERIRSSKERETKRKRKLDPMAAHLKYHVDPDEKLKHSGHHDNHSSKDTHSKRHNSNKSSSSSESVDELDEVTIALLRRKRLEREQAERRKARVLLSDPDVNERYRYSSS